MQAGYRLLSGVFRAKRVDSIIYAYNISSFLLCLANLGEERAMALSFHTNDLSVTSPYYKTSSLIFVFYYLKDPRSNILRFHKLFID